MSEEEKEPVNEERVEDEVLIVGWNRPLVGISIRQSLVPSREQTTIDSDSSSY